MTTNSRQSRFFLRQRHSSRSATTVRLHAEALEERRLLAVAGSEPSIVGTVFVDNDLNGAFTAGEQLEGVSLQLFEDDGDGVFEPGTEDFQVTVDPLTDGFTDANGIYCFSNLELDTQYFVFQPAQTVNGIALQQIVSSVVNPALPDILIDDFDDPTSSSSAQREAVADPTTPSVSGSLTLADETHVIGREREYLAELISGIGEVAIRIDRFDQDLLRFEMTAGVEGRITLTWDGTSSDPNGLGGRDLTDNGDLTGFSLKAGVDLSGAGEEVRIVLQSGGDTSEARAPIPVTNGGVASDHIFIPFTDFVGTADPTSVDGIQLFIGEGSQAIDGQIDYIGVIGPETVDVLNDPGADLAITKSNSISSATPGETIDYTITVENLGPNDVTGALVSDNFDPATFTNVTFTSEAFNGASGNTPSGSGNIADTVDLPNGSSIVYTVTGTVLSSATGNALNTATVTSPSATPDPDPTNNTDDEQDPLTVQADLSIVKDDGETIVAPTSQITYTIIASNNGPSDVVGAVISDTFPAELTNVTFTSTSSNGATGNTADSGGVVTEINDTVNLPAGSSITYTVNATVAASATPGPFTNSATISAPAGTTEIDSTNNSDDDTNEVGDVVDLQINKDDGVATVVPGTNLTYTIEVTNAGPSDATGVVVSDTFPAELTNVTFTSIATGGATNMTASGTGNISDTVNMPSGSTITYTVSADVASDATGSISNTATVTAPSGVFESNLDNNDSTDIDTLVPEIDLAISKTDGIDEITAGGTVNYTLVASNNGPSDAVGVTIQDTFPSEFASVSYTSTAANGASGNTSSGTDNISDTVNLPAGASITYSVTAVLDSSATGSVTNTATITAPNGVTELDSTNNSDNDSVTILPQTVDLSISKTDNVTEVSPGDTVQYVITVENVGTADVTGAVITDNLPTSLTNATFTSTVISGTVSGNSASGSGNIDDTIDIAAGAVVQYDVTATVADSATGTIDNQATITAANDINPADNTATDSDNVIPVVDLRITKTNNVSLVSNGQPISYTITVTNDGPSDASGVTVTDTFPSDLTDVTWTSSAQGGATDNEVSGTGNINDVVNLPAGASVTYNVQATVNTTADEIVNTATVTAPNGVNESNTGNNSATHRDTLDTALASISGFVFFDLDNDGIFDPDESPIADVDIVLLQDGEEIDRVSTDSTGAYLFDDLEPGSYLVREIQPNTFADGMENVDGAIGSITGNDEFSVELGAGDSATGLNFGESIRRPSKRDLLASNFAN